MPSGHCSYLMFFTAGRARFCQQTVSAETISGARRVLGCVRRWEEAVVESVEVAGVAAAGGQDQGAEKQLER